MPSPATPHWLKFGRILACLVLTLVLSLMIWPGEARAHGLHGPSGVTIQIDENDISTKTDVLARFETFTSGCVTCCTSSGCLAIPMLQSHELIVASAPRSAFRTHRTIAVYRTTQHGLRRPPKHLS